MTPSTRMAQAREKLTEIHRLADGAIDWVLQPHQKVRGRIRTLAREALALLSADDETQEGPKTCATCRHFGGDAECFNDVLMHRGFESFTPPQPFACSLHKHIGEPSRATAAPTGCQYCGKQTDFTVEEKSTCQMCYANIRESEAPRR